MTKKIIAVTAGFLLLGAGFSPAEAAATAPADDANACANHTVQTFEVEGWTPKARYRTGDTVTVEVAVERSLDGLGIKQDVSIGPPGAVEGAFVGVVIIAGYERLMGLATTDETGHAVVEIEIPRGTTQGWAIVGARAWKDVVSHPCPITEEGILLGQKMFRIAARR